MGIEQNRENLPTAILEERRFFPLYGDSKDDTPKGWNTPSNWKMLDEIPEGTNFGFNFKDSNYLFIDCDHVYDVQGNLREGVRPWIDRLWKYGPTYTERSVSGKGIHLICDLGDYADDFEPISNDDQHIATLIPIEEYQALSDAEKEQTPKIELFYRTGGRYCLLTGRNSGRVYEVARDETAAAIFREALKMVEECHGGKTAKRKRLLKELRDQEKEEIVQALEFINPDDRETWITVGIALHNEGMPFEVWDEWSSRSDKYNDGKDEPTEKKWKGFDRSRSLWNKGTIFRLAFEGGYQKDRAKDKTAPNDKKTGINLTRLSEVEEQEPDWLIDGYLARGEINILGGDGGSGKTFVWVAIAAAVSNGEQPAFITGCPFGSDRRNKA